MTARPGDKIILKARTRRIHPAGRAGVIEDVLQGDPPRYVVRWNDGRTSVYTPAPGSVTIEPKDDDKKSA